MANSSVNPINPPLPADLPTNWGVGDTVSPNGTEAGLTQQHGYNYLMTQVNAAQSGVNILGEELEQTKGEFVQKSGDTMTGPLETTGLSVGEDNTAGNGATAIGYKTTASGGFSMSQGMETEAAASGAHAEGNRSQAGGINSHAEGENTVASGKGSHAEGGSSRAEGANSHAEGQSCVAAGIGSHAGGYYTTASTDYSTIVGYYGETTPDTLFAVGNGMSESEKSLAFEVRWDGSVLAGSEQVAKYRYGTEDLTAGESALPTGVLYFVYE